MIGEIVIAILQLILIGSISLFLSIGICLCVAMLAVVFVGIFKGVR